MLFHLIDGGWVCERESWKEMHKQKLILKELNEIIGF